MMSVQSSIFYISTLLDHLYEFSGVILQTLRLHTYCDMSLLVKDFSLF